MTVDRNHPLAAFPIDLTVKLLEIGEDRVERGGRSTDWLEEICANGPGLQSRFRGQPTDFGDPDAHRRRDPTDDTHFYSHPRMVGHVDSRASDFIAEAYGRLLPTQGRVLDLMSGLQSHLPAGHKWQVAGLGMNREELAANPVLAERLVHDLNSEPALPFPDAYFEAVICSLSVEYLVQPQTVLREAARVLKPNGLLAISFSNRWFPPKVIELWPRLHEFERIGLILHHLLETRLFTNLSSEAIRNYPRPESDRHYGELFISDPIYIVAGRKIQEIC